MKSGTHLEVAVEQFGKGMFGPSRDCLCANGRPPCLQSRYWAVGPLVDFVMVVESDILYNLLLGPNIHGFILHHSSRFQASIPVGSEPSMWYWLSALKIPFPAVVPVCKLILNPTHSSRCMWASRVSLRQY